MDQYFRVEVVSQTPNPQQLIWLSAHQCVCEGVAIDDPVPSENKAGEYVVKHLLAGNRGHYCYDRETEVLTNLGWQRWDQLKEDSLIGAYNPKTGAIKFEKPMSLTNEFYSGKMIHFKNRAVDLLVTPNHRMVVGAAQKRSFNGFDFVPAIDLIGKGWSFPKSGTLEDSLRSAYANPWGIDKIVFAKLVGFYLGDGDKPREGGNCIRFRLRESRKIQYLKNLNLQIREQKKTDRYVIDFQGIGAWVWKNCLTVEGKKIIPSFFFNATKEEVEGLLDGLKNSDGSIKRKTWFYSSSSRPLVDSIQAVAALNGLDTSCHWNTPKKDTHAPNAKVHFFTGDRFIFEGCPSRISANQSISLVDFQDKVYCATVSTGALIVRRNDVVCVSGNSPLEAPQISFNVAGFPHSVMQQVTRHRIGLHFSVQSFRYTGQRILDVANGHPIESVFYLRPEGEYTDRQGKRYHYSAKMRIEDAFRCIDAAEHYAKRISQGFAEEHARGLIPFDVRQHWVMSANVRSLMHLLDLRFKADAQLEAQQLCELIYPHFEAWVPAIAEWYTKNRKHKARLAP